MNKSKKIINNTKSQILDEIQTKLKQIPKTEKKEIYLHDLIHQTVDSNIAGITRMQGMKLIDYTQNEKYADMGVIDNNSLNRYIETMAFECLYQEIFNDNFFQYLQTELNNEKIDKKQAQKIIKKIQKEKQKYKKPTHTDSTKQIFIETDFKITKQDLTQHIAENQITELSQNTIKIFTNTNNTQEINKNAIVLEKTNKNIFRIYLMQKDKDTDIRNFFTQKEYKQKQKLIEEITKTVTTLMR